MHFFPQQSSCFGNNCGSTFTLQRKACQSSFPSSRPLLPLAGEKHLPVLSHRLSPNVVALCHVAARPGDEEEASGVEGEVHRLAAPVLPGVWVIAVRLQRSSHSASAKPGNRRGILTPASSVYIYSQWRKAYPAAAAAAAIQMSGQHSRQSNQKHDF